MSERTVSCRNDTLERAARSAWRVQVEHRHADGCPQDDTWHSLAVEVWTPPGTDHLLVGDVWWLGDRPAAWLLDWHAHPDTTALIVVTDGTRLTPDGVTSVHVVACVNRDGDSIVLASPGDDPPRAAHPLRGPLYAAMLQAISPA
jgi:hypothetical protein